MSTVPGVLRTKAFLAEYGRPVAVALLLVGILATAGAGYAYANPGTETVVEDRDEQTVVLEQQVTATVAENATLWPPGTELENRPAYLRDETPEATVVTRITVESGELRNVTQTAAIEYRAERDDEVLWSQREPLPITVESTDDGHGTAVPVNATAVHERIQAVEATTGTAASVSATLEQDVTYETDRYDGSVAASTPIDLDGTAYELHPVSETNRHATAEAVEKPLEPNWTVVWTLLGIAALSFTGAGAVVAFVRREPSAEAIHSELARMRYEEWISRGELPTRSERVVLASLDDLVDYAIDTNSRVIYDPEHGEFGVADGRTLYAVSDERPDGDDESVDADPRADLPSIDPPTNAEPSTDPMPTQTDGGEPPTACDSDENQTD